MTSAIEKIEVLPGAPSDADLMLCSQWGITYPQLLDERRSALFFRFPMPPTLTNSGKGRSRHWRALEREKDQYWNHCSNLYYTKQVPHEPPDGPWAKARIMSKMVLGGAMDDDNAMARHKWLLDWLVAYRYIEKDRKSCLVWGGFPEQKVTRKEEHVILLTLTRRA